MLRQRAEAKVRQIEQLAGDSVLREQQGGEPARLLANELGTAQRWI